MKESVLSFEEKQQHNLGLPTFKWLLGYRMEFNSLYLPQGHNFISNVWLGSTDFEWKSIFK